MRVIQGIYNFFKKYKVFHIAFWLFFISSVYHDFQQRHPRPLVPTTILVFNTVLWTVVGVYGIIYVLLPHYLEKRKYGKFALYTFGFLLACTFLTAFFQDHLMVILLKKHLFSYVICMIGGMIDIIEYSLIFVAVITIPRLYLTDQRNKLLEKERLETELNFLKSQVNPHFLFNALNSIYVLIEEDKRLASETLLKFSDMLRYQLYECSVQRMTIGKELTFLKDYAALEKIRNSENVQVTFDIAPDIDPIQIPPFLLLPFIENAFKHISHHTDKPNYVAIHFSSAKDSILIFSVINTYDEQPKEYLQKQGGLGLQNVRRRLQLLYPEKHTLAVETENGLHKIQLTLEIDKDEMYTGR